MNTTSDSPSTSPLIVATPWSFTKPVISEAGVDGEVLQLGPKAERAFDASDRARVFFVAAGAVTVQVGATHYILKADAVLPLPAERVVSVRNHGEEPAKVLSLLLPAPRVEWRLFVPDGGPLSA